MNMINRSIVRHAFLSTVAVFEAADTPKAGTNDVILGDAMDAKARAFAAKANPLLSSAIGLAIKAKQDWEGGKFAVMYAVTDGMTAEEVAELPKPGEENGNNPAVYYVRVIGKGGKPVDEKHNYYNVLSDNIPANKDKRLELELLTLSLGDPAKVNMTSVPQRILDMPKTYRGTAISRIEDELKASRTAVNEAFKLMFQIRAVNDLPGVTAEVIFALDPATGKLLDGEEGRATQVENTRTPILVTTTLDARKAIDTARVGVGSFLKLKPDVAKENGGTYKALFDTVQRTKGGNGDGDNQPGGDKPDQIVTLDKFQARFTDIHSYMDEVWSAKDKAKYNEILKAMGPRGPAGSDDFVLSAYQVWTMLGDVFRHDPIRARAETLNEADILSAKKAAA